MAQQTQAARAGEAWLAFMARFPTVEDLAAASPAEVLRAWQGLGYNRRALALWRAAGRIVDAFDGIVPSDLSALESLPGVGPYTARAVAAIAFGSPVGAVDTNVRRVLGRIVAGDADGLSAATLQVMADEAVPRDRPAAWTHALMDIGATLCRPSRPDCGVCPARAWCRYADSSPETWTAGRIRRGARLARQRPVPFIATSRWLRGRILDRLRDAAEGDWVALDGAIGEHESGAVEVAARALAREGLLELDTISQPAIRARLPIA
jgi:A/G-specific adenine glycosylase